MTLQQTGIEEFKAAPGKVMISTQALSKTPEKVLRERRATKGKVLRILRANLKHYKITFDENQEEAFFKIISTQHLTTGAAEDKRDYHTKDPRCVIGEDQFLSSVALPLAAPVG